MTDFTCAKCRGRIARNKTCYEQHRGGELACHDCGLLYDDPGWLDVTIPADDWAAISPTGGYGGILCITCIARRLEAAGRKDVPLLVGSGPFSHEPERWYQFGFTGGERAARQRIEWEVDA